MFLMKKEPHALYGIIYTLFIGTRQVTSRKFEKFRRHEIFFPCGIFIVDFEYELRIDKNFSIQPVSAHSSNFGTFAGTYPITLKLYQNIEGVILIKNQEKDWQYLWQFS